jgi:adenosylcobinamide-phosphate synthase
MAIARGEAALRHPTQSNLVELVSGAALTTAVVCATYCVSRKVISSASAQSPALGSLLEVILAWNCLAARNLEQEASSVVSALNAADLPLARRRLARIVGRDIEALNTQEVCRAVIETLAESASDGIVAPLFYLALGGVPLALAYKAINTLDSMIGHADEQYFYFGKAAARLDDAANYLPARLTAVAIVAASLSQDYAHPLVAWQIWRRDGDLHKSPNAGQPESAMAGALQVRLGGDSTYRGELVRAVRMGIEFPLPSLSKTRSAIRLVSVVTLLGVCCCTLVAAMTQLCRVSKPTHE